ncbi:hypothetical protein [Spirosoma fluminis]
MKTLIANTTLTGDYGRVEPGDEFSADDEVADSLIERELASEATADDADQKDDKGAAGRKTK